VSARVDITDQIFNDIYVLEFVKNQNTHALYKCLCMLCNEITYITYSNLTKSNNTKSCQRCAQKKISNAIEQDIAFELRNGMNKNQLSKKYGLSRTVFYRIEEDFKTNVLSNEKETNV